MAKRVDQWNWSSYQAMVGESAPPRWLSCDYLLAQFSVQRKAAIRKYRLFVQEGLKHGPIWTHLNNQIYLGDKEFIDKVQRHAQIQSDDLQIPKVQRRSIAKSLSEYERIYKTRDEAIINAYASGAYSYQEIGNYFRLHFTRVGRIVRQQRNDKS